MARPAPLRPFVVAFLSLMLAGAFLPFAGTSEGEVNPPPPGEGITIYHAGDWIIEPGDDVFRGNVTLVLSGNLTVQSGGRLTLSNMTLVMNSTSDGEFGIYVEPGATLDLDRANVTAGNTTAEVPRPSWWLFFSTYGLMYRFQSGGTVRIERSNISYLWTHDNLTEGGLRVWSGVLWMNQTNLSRSAFFGIRVEASSATFTDVRIDDMTGITGIDSDLSVDRVTVDIVRPISGAIVVLNSTATIRDSSFTCRIDCGGATNSPMVSVSRSLFRGNVLVHNTTLLVTRSEFRDSPTGLQIQSGGDRARVDASLISGTLFLNHSSWGLALGQASPTIESSTFEGGWVSGIGMAESSPVIRNSTIRSLGSDLNLSRNSHPLLINTTFDLDPVYFWNDTSPPSTVDARWYLNILVHDAMGAPLSNAAVEVFDAGDQPVFAGFTGPDGYARDVPLRQVVATDVNRDTDSADSGDRTYDTPHRVRATHLGRTGEATVLMNRSREVVITVGTPVNYTVTRDPPVGNVTVDGTASPAPSTFQWIEGGEHEVSVPTEEERDGTRYVFRAWSDGGARTHNVTVGSTDAVLTALYDVQYRVSLLLPGTDADHRVTVTYAEGGVHRIVETWVSWTGWVDDGTQLEVGRCTSGEAPRCTGNATSWAIVAPASFTVTYEAPAANYKPAVAAAFAALIALLGAVLSRRDRERSARRQVLGLGLTLAAAEFATGLASALTGWLSIPPVLGVGTVVDASLLAASLLTIFLVHRRFRQANAAASEGKDSTKGTRTEQP